MTRELTLFNIAHLFCSCQNISFSEGWTTGGGTVIIIGDNFFDGLQVQMQQQRKTETNDKQEQRQLQLPRRRQIL